MQVLGVKIDNAKGAKGNKKRLFTNFSAWIFARTEQRLEQYCKIKNNNLSFWVDEAVSLLGYEVVSYQSDELMNLWNPKLPSWRTDKTKTSHVYEKDTGEQAAQRANLRQVSTEPKRNHQADEPKSIVRAFGNKV